MSMLLVWLFDNDNWVTSLSCGGRLLGVFVVRLAVHDLNVEIFIINMTICEISVWLKYRSLSENTGDTISYLEGEI